MSASPVYLDAATAAPMHPVARQALLAALDDGWADPGKLYSQARRARQLLDAAREATALTLGVRADEVSFTPSGTTAAHGAVLGGLAGRHRVGSTLVHSAIEHSAVLHAAERHVGGGRDRDRVPVDRVGRLDLTAWSAAVRAPGVALAALITASHEVGTVQPVAEAAAVCAEAGVPLYVDAAQSVGRVPLPAGWSVLSASAHKWGGPPGVGVLAVRKGTRWESPWPADEREGGRTPGVVNLPAVVAAAASLRAAAADAAAEAARLAPLVDRIRDAGRGGGARRGGGRRPGAPAPPPGHLLVPVRRRRGAAARTGPAGLRRVVRLVLHVVHVASVARAGGDGGALARQRAGQPAPGDDRGGRRAVPRPSCPGSSPSCAPTPGWWGCDDAGRGHRLPGAALPAAGDRGGPADATAAGRHGGPGARRRPGGGGRHPRLVPDARPGVPRRRSTARTAPPTTSAARH